MDSRNLAIGILSTTASILLVGLVLLHSQSQPAYGFGMNAQGGDYLLTTGQLQPSQELLYVIDATQERMLVYRFDINKKTIIRTDGAKLKDIRAKQDGNAAGSGTPDGRRSGRRR